MHCIDFDPSKNLSPDEIEKIARLLKAGKTLAYPSDTVYGLGCAADNARAVAKVFKIKKIDQPKPLIILVSSIFMLEKYCRINKSQKDYLKKIWPAPITAILDSRDILPKKFFPHDMGIAARIPKSKYLIDIIKKIGAPIISTSLNISGEAPIMCSSDIEKKFKIIAPDIVLAGGLIKNKKPSKIIDLRDINHIKVIRK